MFAKINTQNNLIPLKKEILYYLFNQPNRLLIVHDTLLITLIIPPTKIISFLIYHYTSQEKDKDSKNISSALKKSSRYRSRSLSASSTDSYSSGMWFSLCLNKTIACAITKKNCSVLWSDYNHIFSADTMWCLSSLCFSF